ncbi:alpha-galactosidase [Candidatus Bipolaricaulota bacterium]|nr:alpha-galactosidase [Candidatus Bipolaricaulota bacterium]
MRGPKVTIIGAGSFFTNAWISDIALADNMEAGTFALIDIDEERLELSKKMAEKLVSKIGTDWEVVTSSDREKLLPESDYLINTIEVSGVENVEKDYEIPKKYGIDQCIGDTIGPGGIMKAFRTIPTWLEILEDAERLCPEALVMNYTNPMHMMTLAANKGTDMEIAGLCHSVQGTSRQLANYLDLPYEELNWECAGINHMSWFTKLEHQDRNLYPELLKKAENSEIYDQDPIRFEMAKEFGYFVTESSGHFSEYLPYFRKNQDLIDSYCGEGYKGESGFYSKNWPEWRRTLDEFRRKWIKGEKVPKELKEDTPGLENFDPEKRSLEYGSYIIEAVETGEEVVVYGNFPNEGLIDNLPRDGIVEVKTLVDGTGFHPCKFGSLPEQLAGLNRSNMTVHKLVVDSILNEDRESAVRAFMLDPLTAAVSTPSKIRDMAKELFAAERNYIPDYLTK